MSSRLFRFALHCYCDVRCSLRLKMHEIFQPRPFTLWGVLKGEPKRPTQSHGLKTITTAELVQNGGMTKAAHRGMPVETTNGDIEPVVSLKGKVLVFSDSTNTLKSSADLMKRKGRNQTINTLIPLILPSSHTESIFESPRSFRDTVGACLKNRGAFKYHRLFYAKTPGSFKRPRGMVFQTKNTILIFLASRRRCLFLSIRHVATVSFFTFSRLFCFPDTLV